MYAPACHLATDGFLNCALSKATVGFLYCPEGTGPAPGTSLIEALMREDNDILCVVACAVNIIHQ